MSIDGGLWPLVKAHLSGPGVDFQRIESGAVGSGCPDLNYCIDGVDGWIEFKATENYTVVFRQEQPGWIARRTRAGGRVLILTRRRHGGGPRKGEPVDELWVHWGRDVFDIHSGGLLAAKLALCQEGGPRYWDWGLVRQTLVGPMPAFG